MKTHIAILLVGIIVTMSLLTACSKSEQEKYYEKLNQQQEQAEKEAKKAAEDIKNFKPSTASQSPEKQ